MADIIKFPLKKETESTYRVSDHVKRFDNAFPMKEEVVNINAIQTNLLECNACKEQFIVGFPLDFLRKVLDQIHDLPCEIETICNICEYPNIFVLNNILLLIKKD